MAASKRPATLEDALRMAVAMDAPLKQRLAIVAQAVRDHSPAFAVAVDRMVARLQENGAGAVAPAVGDLMPPFALPDQNGKVVRLADVIGDGPAVISFHRGHWCPYCRLNAAALAKAEKRIAELGGHVVAITPERASLAVSMRKDAGAAFPFLADVDNGYALSLGLAIWVGAELEALMGPAGDSPEYQGRAHWVLPIPATFVVASDGVIVARYVDPDFRTRMDIEDLIDAVRRARERRKTTSPSP